MSDLEKVKEALESYGKGDDGRWGETGWESKDSGKPVYVYQSVEPWKEAEEALAELNKYMERLDSESILDEAAKAIYELEPNYNSLGEKMKWHNLEDSHLKQYYKNQAQAAINVIKGE